MERSLTFTTSSPSRFFSHGVSKHPQLNPIPSSSSTSLRRKRISVETIKCSRNTLSAGWNLSNSSPQWMPSSKELDSTNMLLRQRIVFLGFQVDELTADFIISQLLFLDAEDSTKDIRLFINSPGGSITAGMGIYDAMKLCKADVSTVCFGLAASMGAFLLASGSKGKRFCMPNAKVMIHEPIGFAGGSPTDTALRVREMCYHKVKMNKILSRITGKPEQQIASDTERDYFMNPWEAKEYGLVDEVINDGKPGLVAPIGDGSPPPKPDLWFQFDAEGNPSEEKFLSTGKKEIAKPV